MLRDSSTMRPAAIGWVCAALMVVCLCVGVAAPRTAIGAEDVDSETRHAVRGVIEAQLRALSSGDASRAYDYATPAIRARFKDAPAFLEMVRTSFPMVATTESASFMLPIWGAGVILQPVQLRDRDGHYWRAIYELQRQSDMQWRINGCVVADDDDTART